MIFRGLALLSAFLIAFALPSEAQAQSGQPMVPSSTGGSQPTGNVVNVLSYGARGDTQRVTDGALTSGSHTVTSATGLFKLSDVGKVIFGIDSGGTARLPIGTITAVSSGTSVTASTTATNTLSNIWVVWGTDDTTAIQNASAAAKAVQPSGAVYLPAGGYLFSKLLFNLQYSATTKTISVFGDGRNATILYAAPNYDFTSTAANQGMITRFSNAQWEQFSDFTVDGSNFSFNGPFNYVAMTTNAYPSWRNIGIINFGGSLSGGLTALGVGTYLQALHIETVPGPGLLINGNGGDCFGCYSGNATSGCSVQVLNVNGAGDVVQGFRYHGGIIDESPTAGLCVQNSTDVSIIGSRVFGIPLTGHAATVDGTSVVRFTNSEIIPFGTGNRNGLQVLSGGVAYLSQTRVDKSGTGVALDNAGTVYTDGAFPITSITGTAPIATSAVIPNSCSGLPTGALFNSTGTPAFCP